MKIPTNRILEFDDIIRGNVTFSSELIDDQVLIKSDGYPTYHLANVVDDHLMKVSHVIRGEEWLPSVPKHILLYEYFGWEIPKFAHLPLLLNPDKSKLSKRQGDVAVEDYKAKGYLKEALINFVALLGWNPGTTQEIFNLNDLIKEFSLERVNKAGAIFNIEKLNWLNFEHLRLKDESEVLAMLKEYLTKTEYHNKNFNDDYLLKIINAMRERVQFVRDFVDKSKYFFEPPKDYDTEILQKRWKKESSSELSKIVDAFSLLNDPIKEDYEKVLHLIADELGIGVGKLIHIVRLAISGKGTGPGLYDILFILGKDESIKRINHAIKNISI